MDCPHCRKELKLPNYAWYNSENRPGKAYAVVTECCGLMVSVCTKTYPEVSVCDKEVDDWGIRPNPNHLKKYQSDLPEILKATSYDSILVWAIEAQQMLKDGMDNAVRTNLSMIISQAKEEIGRRV